MILINQILLVILILLILNYFTKGQLKIIFEKSLQSCMTNIENFIGSTYTNKERVFNNVPNIKYSHQKDYPYISTTMNDNIMDGLYNYISNLRTVNINNYELNNSNSKRIPADYKLENNILKQLYNVLNCKHYKFEKIKLLDKIYYYENYRGKDIEPFNFSADVYFKNKIINKMTFYIEIFIRNDHYNSDYITILNIKLINIPSNNNKMKAIMDMRTRNTQIDDLFQNYFVKNDNLIKSNINNDSDNSLIPSTVDISNDSTNDS